MKIHYKLNVEDILNNIYLLITIFSFSYNNNDIMINIIRLKSISKQIKNIIDNKDFKRFNNLFCNIQYKPWLTLGTNSLYKKIVIDDCTIVRNNSSFILPITKKEKALMINNLAISLSLKKIKSQKIIKNILKTNTNINFKIIEKSQGYPYYSSSMFSDLPYLSSYIATIKNHKWCECKIIRSIFNSAKKHIHLITSNVDKYFYLRLIL